MIDILSMIIITNNKAVKENVAPFNNAYRVVLMHAPSNVFASVNIISINYRVSYCVAIFIFKNNLRGVAIYDIFITSAGLLIVHITISFCGS